MYDFYPVLALIWPVLALLPAILGISGVISRELSHYSVHEAHFDAKSVTIIL